jgi:GNAT superfamily N-acetyltransferase
MDLIYRQANPDDYKQIIELIREFAEYEQRPDRMVNSEKRMREEKDFFNAIVVETRDRSMVAYLSYFICYYTWIGKSFYIDDFYVRPEFRGKGIGTTLFNKAVGMAQENRCHKMRWQVSKWNEKAMAFYHNMGALIEDIELDCDLMVDQ